MIALHAASVVIQVSAARFSSPRALALVPTCPLLFTLLQSETSIFTCITQLGKMTLAHLHQYQTHSLLQDLVCKTVMTC